MAHMARYAVSPPLMDDWGAVGDAIGNRMRELRSVLVAISAVLRWRYDHLLNILLGEPQRHCRERSARPSPS